MMFIDFIPLKQLIESVAALNSQQSADYRDERSMRNTKEYSKKSIKCGDRILTESPLVYILKSKYRFDRCDNCLTEHKSMKCCYCQYVFYCNEDCQAESWAFHKFECAFLKRVDPEKISDTARMLFRLIVILRNGGQMKRGYYTKSCYRKFKDLMSHYAELINDLPRLKHLESLQEIIWEILDDRNDLPNAKEFLTIYGRMLINSFNILDAEMNSIGTGLYLGVSITDHSCRPNAVATFEGKILHIHAIEDMPCLNWHRVYISYIDLLQTPDQRSDELMAKYYFLCKCVRCCDVYEVQEMNAAACPNKYCQEYLDTTIDHCPRCGEEITPNYRQLFENVMLLTKCQLKDTNDVIFLDACKVCLQMQKICFHPLNLWHIKTLDAAFEASFHVGKWKAALKYGLELLPGYRKYYGCWNPLLGLLYMKIAKIQLYNGSFKMAFSNLERARKILEITHGNDHSLVRKQLSELLLQAVERRK